MASPGVNQRGFFFKDRSSRPRRDVIVYYPTASVSNWGIGWRFSRWQAVADLLLSAGGAAIVEACL